MLGVRETGRHDAIIPDSQTSFVGLTYLLALRNSERPVMRKSSRKLPATHRKRTAKATVAQKVHGTHHKISSKAASQKMPNARGIVDPHFEKFLETQVPDAMRNLAEKNLAGTRELYERSKNALHAVMASWEKSFTAVGQDAVTFNRKIMDLAECNINTGFDLATSLAGTQNLAEAMSLQADYWRKHVRDLNAQAEEVRRAAAKMAADMAEPLRMQIGKLEFRRS